MGITGRHAQPMRTFLRQDRITAPPDLAPELVELWDQCVAQCPSGQLRAGDLPLLRVYVDTTALAREANERLRTEGQVLTNGRPSPWVGIASSHAKTLSTIAQRLRLCVSSRVRPESAALQASAGPRPASAAPDDTDDLIPFDDDDLIARDDGPRERPRARARTRTRG